MNTLPNVRAFAPEYWGEVGKFHQFHTTTHEFTPHSKKAVSGIKGHFEKARTLLAVAQKLAPNMQIDNAELQEKGFTPAANSREVTAVIEEVFTELYSSIDCASKVVSFIYRRVRRMPDSTRKLFRLASNGEFGDDFPVPLKEAFVAASWYDELRTLRDELTHANIGSCHLDQDGKVFYMHTGIRVNNNVLLFPDVFAKLEEIFTGVNLFLGRVFHFLNQGLIARPVDAFCGFFFGRGYARKLIIAEQIDFNSGVCQSRQWFDKQPEFRCPFASTCGAYAEAEEATMTRKEVVEALALDERSSLALRNGENLGARFKIHSPWVISRTMPVIHSKNNSKNGPQRAFLLLAPAGDQRTIAASKHYPLETSTTDALTDFLGNHASKFTRAPNGERLSRREAHELGEPWLKSYAIRLALRLHRRAVFRAAHNTAKPAGSPDASV